MRLSDAALSFVRASSLFRKHLNTFFFFSSFFLTIASLFLDPKAILNMILTHPMAWTALSLDSCDNYHLAANKGQKRKHSRFERGTTDNVLPRSAPRWLNTRWPLKRWKDGKTSASCSASAVSLKLFKFVHHILLPPFLRCQPKLFEPTCHSAGRSTSMRFQTSLRWANIHAACPCSAHCLGTQTGHKQDNLIVPCCVPHGSVLSGFADGELSGVLPADLLT